MKVFFAILLGAVLLPGVPTLASSADGSPLIGSWTVDVTRLPMPPQARPKSVTVTFSDSGPGKWTTNVDIVDSTGAESHSVGTNSLDGMPAPVTGSIEADVAAVKMPAPNVLVLMLAKEGIPGSTRIYSVSADGKTMIETATYFGDKGQPLMRTHYFSRVR
jgi:hypothetical protein